MKWCILGGVLLAVLVALLWIMPVYQWRSELDAASGSVREWKEWLWWPGRFAAASWESPIERRMRMMPGVAYTPDWRLLSVNQFTSFGKVTMRRCRTSSGALTLSHMREPFEAWADKADDTAIQEAHRILLADDKKAIERLVEQMVDQWIPGSPSPPSP